MDQSFRPKRRSLVSRYFAFLERRSFGDRVIFNSVLIIFLVTLLYIASAVSNRFITESPTTGGTITEGIIGTPRFVNPVLALTRADQDVTALIYSGLLKLTTEGTLVPDLAESVTISPDGRTYDIFLKKGVTFHNGTPFTSKDVGYTISLIKNPELKSPLRGNWEGVQVNIIDDHHLTLTLSEAYTPFLENLTVGILPQQLWSDVALEQLPFSQLNALPVGTGPYTIENVHRDSSGLITQYDLISSQTSTNITKIILKFFPNQEQLTTAFTEKMLTSSTQLPETIIDNLDNDRYAITEFPLPRTFGIFLNQNKSIVLRDSSVREALDIMIDRAHIVDEALSGRGIPTNSPIPAGFSTLESNTGTTTTSTTSAERQTTAETILIEAGWERSDDNQWQKEIDDNLETLSVTISTANTEVFQKTAELVANSWEQLGVVVTINQYEQADLVQSVIRPRSFEALLFGTDLNRSLDLYPFWHSSQRDDPGLNITQYTNIDTDVFLERIRMSTSTDARDSNLQNFTEIISEERPALFLYTPTFTYVVDNKVNLPTITHLTDPSDRFSNIDKWYIEKERLWSIFK